MSAVDLIDQAWRLGLVIERDDDTLRVRGPRSAAPLVRALLEHKTEVLANLDEPATIALWGTAKHDRANPPGIRGHPAAPVTVLVPRTETGPCARCRQPTHRYGQRGAPLCPDCQKGQPHG